VQESPLLGSPGTETVGHQHGTNGHSTLDAAPTGPQHSQPPASSLAGIKPWDDCCHLKANGLQLAFFHADVDGLLNNISINVLSNAANGKLNHGAGIAQAIVQRSDGEHQVISDAFMKRTRDSTGRTALLVGELAILPFKHKQTDPSLPTHVAHVVVPRAQNSDKGATDGQQNLLTESIFQLLRTVNDASRRANKRVVLALTLMGCGVYQWKIEQSVNVLVDAIKDFLVQHAGQVFINKVVIYDREAARVDLVHEALTAELASMEQAQAARRQAAASKESEARLDASQAMLGLGELPQPPQRQGTIPRRVGASTRMPRSTSEQQQPRAPQPQQPTTVSQQQTAALHAPPAQAPLPVPPAPVNVEHVQAPPPPAAPQQQQSVQQPQPHAAQPVALQQPGFVGPAPLASPPWQMQAAPTTPQLQAQHYQQQPQQLQQQAAQPLFVQQPGFVAPVPMANVPQQVQAPLPAPQAQQLQQQQPQQQQAAQPLFVQQPGYVAPAHLASPPQQVQAPQPAPQLQPQQLQQPAQPLASSPPSGWTAPQPQHTLPRPTNLNPNFTEFGVEQAAKTFAR
jgi:O-acetyl-ADP-ribose deacetylase (regulator of RNase III)